MSPEKARAISVNHCVRDDELERIDALHKAAQPGVWRVRDGRVVRLDGTPVDSPESLAFMADVEGSVPRLIRGIRVLEDALLGLEARVISIRAAAQRAEEASTAALDRAYKGETGPEEDIGIIASAAALGIFQTSYIERAFRHWAKGGAIERGYWLNLIIDHGQRSSWASSESSESATCAQPGDDVQPVEIDWSARMSELRDAKPRPVKRRYGKNPTPEQIAECAEKERAWNTEYRRASKMQKAQLEASNAAWRAKHEAPSLFSESA